MRQAGANALLYMFWSYSYHSMFWQLCLIVKKLLLPCHMSFRPGYLFRTIHSLTQEVHSLISELFPSGLSGKFRSTEMNSAKVSQSPIYGWLLGHLCCYDDGDEYLLIL